MVWSRRERKGRSEDIVTMQGKRSEFDGLQQVRITSMKTVLGLCYALTTSYKFLLRPYCVLIPPHSR